jgi:hypothetical protein
LLADAFAEYDQVLAKQEALCRAFNSSGQTKEAFADMYGLDVRDVAAMLEQHQLRNTTQTSTPEETQSRMPVD